MRNLVIQRRITKVEYEKGFNANISPPKTKELVSQVPQNKASNIENSELTKIM